MLGNQCNKLASSTGYQFFTSPNGFELREILDAAVERVDGTNLLRIRGDRQRVSLRGLEVHGARQGVAVDDERQATSGEDVWAV